MGLWLGRPMGGACMWFPRNLDLSKHFRVQNSHQLLAITGSFRTFSGNFFPHYKIT